MPAIRHLRELLRHMAPVEATLVHPGLRESANHLESFIPGGATALLTLGVGAEHTIVAARLGCADLIGADLPEADLGGALFLTASQTVSLRGDKATRLPAGLERPVYW